jgi:hypothetical protein
MLICRGVSERNLLLEIGKNEPENKPKNPTADERRYTQIFGPESKNSQETIASS